MATDYKTRLIADTSQHDNALKKSASQVYKFKKTADNAGKSIASMAGSVSKFAGALGLAYSGMEVFKMAMQSSEPMADKFSRTLDVAKSSVTAFVNSFMNGSFESCIGHLDKIAEAARNAFDALDSLGTNQMWANLGLADIDAQIANVRALIAGGDTSNETAKKLEALIQQRTNIVNGLNADTQEAVKTAIVKMIGEFNSDLSTLISGLTNEEYRQVEYTLGRIAKSGNPHAAIERYAATYHRQGGTGRTELNAINGQWEEIWNSESIKRIYTVISNLENVSEEQLKPILALLMEQQQRKQQNAQVTAKALKMGGKLGGDSSSKYEAGSIADIEKQISDLQNRLKNEVLKGNEAAVIQKQIDVLKTKKDVLESLGKPMEKMSSLIETMPTLDASIIDGDGIAAELQKAIDAIQETGLTIEDLTNLEAVGDSFGYIGDMFSSLSETVGDESGKVFSAVGNSISAIGQAIAKISALMMSEGAASAFALPYPASLAALASVIAAVTGVIGSIQSVASQSFAEGGIFQGRSTIGDYNLARVNSGEMILNGTQQARLFRMLNNPTINASVPDLGGVTFTIHGSDLQGTLNNYNRKRGRAI